MLNKDVEERMLLSVLKDKVGEQKEELRKIKKGEKEMALYRAIDAELSGIITAVLMYFVGHPFYDTTLEAFREIEDMCIERFGKQEGFVTGFLGLQKYAETLGKVPPRQQSVQGK